MNEDQYSLYGEDGDIYLIDRSTMERISIIDEEPLYEAVKSVAICYFLMKKGKQNDVFNNNDNAPD